MITRLIGRILNITVNTGGYKGNTRYLKITSLKRYISLP